MKLKIVLTLTRQEMLEALTDYAQKKQRYGTPSVVSFEASDFYSGVENEWAVIMQPELIETKEETKEAQ